MAKLTITTFATTDGVMQAPGAPEMGALLSDVFARADAFLLGRRTYDLFAAYWPHVTDPENMVAFQLNRRPKYVATHTRDTLGWSRTKIVRDVETAVDQLLRDYSGEVQIHGSAELAQTLLDLDLVDECNVIVMPAIAGIGKRLFGRGTVPVGFDLVRSKTTGTGIVMSTYRRDSALRPGAFELDARAAAE